MKIIKATLKEIKNPIYIISTLILYLILKLLSASSKKISPLLSTSVSLTIWLTLFSLLSVLVMSYLLSGIVSNIKSKKFINGANKFFPKTFITLVLSIIISILLGRAVHYLALFISSALTLSITTAQVVFFSLYFLALAGVQIFITFAPFLIALKNATIKQSFRESIKFVKRNYIEAFSAMVILFVAFYLTNLLPNLLGEIIEYGLIAPFALVYLTILLKTK